MTREAETHRCSRCGLTRIVNTSRPAGLCSDCKYTMSTPEQRAWGHNVSGVKPAITAAEIIEFAKQEGTIAC